MKKFLFASFPPQDFGRISQNFVAEAILARKRDRITDISRKDAKDAKGLSAMHLALCPLGAIDFGEVVLSNI